MTKQPQGTTMLKGSNLPFAVDEGGNIIFTRSLAPVVHSKKQSKNESLVTPSNAKNDNTSSHHEDSIHDDFCITETQDLFHLSIDLPGVQKNDLQVQVVNGLLHVEGVRHYIGNNNDTKVYDKSFRLDANAIDVPKLSANLREGVLVISAPKVLQQGSVRTIPVTQRPHPLPTNSISGNGGKQKRGNETRNESSTVNINHWGYQH